MPWSRRQWMPSLLLALVLVGGGIGLPLADALIFHARPGSAAPRETSIEGLGSVVGHQQLCLQLKATGQARSVPGRGTPVAIVPRDHASRVITLSPVPVSSPVPSSRFSRAPPDRLTTG